MTVIYVLVFITWFGVTALLWEQGNKVSIALDKLSTCQSDLIQAVDEISKRVNGLNN